MYSAVSWYFPQNSSSSIHVLAFFEARRELDSPEGYRQSAFNLQKNPGFI